MAKPSAILPGNSGHIHLSLTSLSTGQNLFYSPSSPQPSARTTPNDPLATHFLAGLLTALPSIFPLLAPTINSYKRLAALPSSWTPTHVS
ncbi:putative glutamine synthetase [Diplodia seriata]|uniref:Putative glutamine synthetase n=1 Tax=Diplodia seriata TaxID=420778 RepID=A0A0G2DQV9_9PEZI|nr:putative glutamine synthetase [Diplodia seriata]